MSETKHDETIPGGRYLVNGEYVDANGNPVAAPAKAKAKTEAKDDSQPKEAAPATDSGTK